MSSNHIEALRCVLSGIIKDSTYLSNQMHRNLTSLGIKLENSSDEAKLELSAISVVNNFKRIKKDIDVLLDKLSTEVGNIQRDSPENEAVFNELGIILSECTSGLNVAKEESDCNSAEDSGKKKRRSLALKTILREKTEDDWVGLLDKHQEPEESSWDAVTVLNDQSNSPDTDQQCSPNSNIEEKIKEIELEQKEDSNSSDLDQTQSLLKVAREVPYSEDLKQYSETEENQLEEFADEAFQYFMNEIDSNSDTSIDVSLSDITISKAKPKDVEEFQNPFLHKKLIVQIERMDNPLKRSSDNLSSSESSTEEELPVLKKRKRIDSSCSTPSDLEEFLQSDSEEDKDNTDESTIVNSPSPTRDIFEELLKCDNSSDFSESEEEEVLSKPPKDRELAKKKPEEISERERRSSWRNDPLLTSKLFSSDSENEEERSEDFTDLDKDKVKETVGKEDIDPDNDTDIEIPKEESLEDLNKVKKELQLKKEWHSEVLSISDSCSDSDSDVIDTTDKLEKDSTQEDLSGRKGRRNIRKLMDDSQLALSTQRANVEEELRIQRMKEKKKKVQELRAKLKDLDPNALLLDISIVKDKPESLVVHEALSNYLKPHQKEGVQFMFNSCYESLEHCQKSPGTGCILAHCMGLGKTMQVCALVHTLLTNQLTNTKKVLIVCPLSTIANWKNELKKTFRLTGTQNIRIYYYGSQGITVLDKMRMIANWKEGIFILGYEAFEKIINRKNYEQRQELVQRVRVALVDPGPDLIVCDEGHLIRNATTRRSQALNQVKTRRRIVLTGTPLQNNLNEYYQMIRFVKPNLLGTKREFKTNFVNPITNGQYDDSTPADISLMKKRTHILHKLLKRTVQRIEVEELKKYLPPIRDYALFIQLSDLQKELYEAFIAFTSKRYLHLTKSLFFQDYYALSGLCSHPYLIKLMNDYKKVVERDVISYEEEVVAACKAEWLNKPLPSDIADEIEYGTKFLVLKAIIEEVEAAGEKILVFSQSLKEMDCLEHFLKNLGTIRCRRWVPQKDYCRMDGTIRPSARSEMCDAFNNKSNQRLRLFLMSYKVGGLGLNLTAANRVVLLGVNFNPSYDTQSVFRAYRFGQDKEVVIYRLISSGTMEEKVYQRGVTKLAIAGRVVDKHQIQRHYNSMELMEMYNYNFPIGERPVPALPEDVVLANVIRKCPCIYKYHEHQGLLENRPEEELDEHEKNLAWEEFNKMQANGNLVNSTEIVPNLNVVSTRNQTRSETSKVEEDPVYIGHIEPGQPYIAQTEKATVNKIMKDHSKSFKPTKLEMQLQQFIDKHTNQVPNLNSSKNLNGSPELQNLKNLLQGSGVTLRYPKQIVDKDVITLD